MSGTLLDRNRELLRRARDLGPLADRLAGLLRRGKREQLLAARDADGSPFAPLAPSTLRRRPGRDPRPLLPMGDASSLPSTYVVQVAVQAGRLDVSAGWPGRPELRYLRTGTRRMPRRDPGGFRREDLDEARRMLREYVTDGR